VYNQNLTQDKGACGCNRNIWYGV